MRPVQRRVIRNSAFLRREVMATSRARTRISPVVKNFANSFPNSFDGIRQMVNAIAKFRLVHYQTLRKQYGKWSATKVIAKGKIPTRMLVRDAGVPSSPLVGCCDMADSLIASLRAKKILARHVRAAANIAMMLDKEPEKFRAFARGQCLPHSYVRFAFEGNEFLADPFAFDPTKRIIPIDKNVLGIISELKRVKRYGEGRDAWDPRIGLYSLMDLRKEKARFKKVLD